MKKIVLILMSLFILTGCTDVMNNPRKRTEELFIKYNSLNEEVIKDIDSMLVNAVDKSYIDDYKEIYKRQYKNLKSEILDETIEGDNATVKVKVTVYDYFNVRNTANLYSRNHQKEFLTNNEFDKNKYTEYLIKKLKDTKERTEYTINIKLNKIDKSWKVLPLTETDIDKINGTFMY